MKYDEDADQYLVEVQVRNTGSVPGKCAVLVYAQTPYGTYEQTNEVEKSAIQLWVTRRALCLVRMKQRRYWFR